MAVRERRRPALRSRSSRSTWRERGEGEARLAGRIGFFWGVEMGRKGEMRKSRVRGDLSQPKVGDGVASQESGVAGTLGCLAPHSEFSLF